MAHSKRLQDKTLQSYLSLPVDVVTEYNFLIQDLSTACVNRSHSLYKQTQDPLRAALLNLRALLLNFLPSSPPNSHSPCHSAFLLTLGKIAGVEIDGLRAMFMICWESHEDILIKKGSQFEEEDARKNTQKKRKKLKGSTAGLNITLPPLYFHLAVCLLFVRSFVWSGAGFLFVFNTTDIFHHIILGCDALFQSFNPNPCLCSPISFNHPSQIQPLLVIQQKP